MNKLIFFLSFILTLHAQPVLEYTKKSERDKFYSELITQKINNNFSVELSPETEKNRKEAFWASQLIDFKGINIEPFFEEVFPKFFDLSTEFQRSFLEALYQYKNADYSNEVFSLLNKIKNEKNFAMAANYLLNRKFDKNKIFANLEENFPEYFTHPILFSLSMQIQNTRESELINRPSLESFLTHIFPTSGIVVFSFQRVNRDFHGITIIRNSEGNFIKDENGSIFYVEHLARAISNLPGYLTNGNTPQGIFSIQGTAISKNYFIGPTENLQLVLPFEVNASNYFNFKELDTIDWDEELYINLLPEEWKNYSPIWEAYYAGKAGRNEIIAHGTTVDPEFYSGASYYPNTPTLGCISAKEIWDLETGAREISDQQKFIDAIKSTGNIEGFFVLIEIDNQQKDISIEEITTFINNIKKD